MRKLLFLLFFTLMLATLVIAAEAAGVTVYDRAELFTEEERAALSAENNIAGHDVQYYLVTATSRLSDSYVQRVCNIGSEDAAVVLVIEQTNGAYYYEMFTYNAADDLLSDTVVNEILDASDVYGNIKSGNLTAGAKAFFDRSEKAIDQAYVAEAEREKRAPFMALLTALVVGALAAGGSVLGILLYYRRKQHGETYPLDRYARMHLTESHDRFVGSYVTRVRVQSSSGGGGGGGGGRASGGSRGRR